MEKVKRLIWADALKGYLILTVILGHAIQYCLPDSQCEGNYWWRLIYSFHMAAFFTISGFVNYKSGGEYSLKEDVISFWFLLCCGR